FEAAHRGFHLFFQTVCAQAVARLDRQTRLRRPRSLADALTHLDGKIDHANLLGVTEEDRALEDVLELANVARPAIRDELLHRVRLDAGDLLFQALVELVDEVPAQERNVRDPL